MKNLLLLFVLLNSFNGAAAVVGNQNQTNTVTILGRVIDLADPNIKRVVSGNRTANNFDSAQYYLTGTTIVDASIPLSKKMDSSRRNGTVRRFYRTDM